MPRLEIKGKNHYAPTIRELLLCDWGDARWLIGVTLKNLHLRTPVAQKMDIPPDPRAAALKRINSNAKASGPSGGPRGASCFELGQRAFHNIQIRTPMAHRHCPRNATFRRQQRRESRCCRVNAAFRYFRTLIIGGSVKLRLFVPAANHSSRFFTARALRRRPALRR